ncbi:unnamed protein product [Leptidea sinapis]|uniref:Uncharacterized protein n=1 Tax=Leptidea sinapis TaxID=189913 RepID=A0A5E4PYU0_9NEOP|nr:unnamed protein product [Leptidea sinapis]
MTTESAQKVTKTFNYSFPTCTNKDVFFKLEVPVDIPYDGSSGELVQRIIKMFRIPVFLEDGIIKNWEKSFKDNVLEYAEQKGSSDEEVFAAAYHKLVHSPALDTIMQVESSYANTVMSSAEQ